MSTHEDLIAAIRTYEEENSRFEKHGYKVVKEQQAKAHRLYLTNFVMEKTL